jgi:hypothetical protein
MAACGHSVREPQDSPSSNLPRPRLPSPLAHPSNRLLINLNPGWRIIEDDLQYILQHRKGSSRSKATGWLSRSFCRRRDTLLRCIHEYCSSVDPEALQQVNSLPDPYVDAGARSTDTRR